MKGQSRYLVGAGVLVFVIVFYGLTMFSMEYVLQNAFNDMEENHWRYESAAHSYMMMNGGVGGINYRINDNKLASTMSEFSLASNREWDDLCYSEPAGDTERYGIEHPDRYKSTFLLNKPGSGECYIGNSNDYLSYPSMQSFGIIRLPMFFPYMQFYGTESQKLFYLQTRVGP
jgi:hypothetical protein